MNNIIIGSTVRKALYSVMLLGLIFSTLGASNMPTPQVLISRVPAGATLLVSLSSGSKLERQPLTILASNCSGGFSSGQINSYIQCEFSNSPLIGYGTTFVSDGQTYNVDPRFVVAISAAESSFGTNGNCATQYHNAWGYGGGWPSCWNFSSWQAAIQQVTADIGTNYLPKGQDTIASFVITPAGTCTKHCWCASGCTSWVATVQQVYQALGGNPNTNNLSYTGNSGGGGGGSAPSTPSSPNPSDGSTLGRTTAITLYWSTNGTSCDISISGGPGTNINQNGVSCSSFTLGQQWPGSYQWHVTAHNSHGTTTGPTWHFNVQPYAPSNLNASTAAQTQINLSWTKSSDDPGSVDSYNVYYSNGSLITNIGAGSTSYHVGSLTCNTGYSFYVKAVRQGVLSNASNTASATTNACGSAPSTPSNPSPSDTSTLGRTTNITLSWNTSGTSCDISISGGPSISINQNGVSCSSFTLGQQWPGSYQWHVTAHNSYGTTTGPTWHFNVQPYAPSNLNASTAAQTQINLSWTKSSDDPGSVDSYNVYYSNGSLITNIGAGSTSYHVGSLTCNTGYSFYVKAVRQGVLSNASNTASTTTSSCITNTAPNTPSNLIISDHTAYSITIAWNSVSKETGYKIYRWDGGTRSFVYLASVGANTTTYTETRSTCGWDQYYEVGAFNNYGKSVLTGWVHGYTLACPPASALSNELSSSAIVIFSFPLIQ